MDHTHQFCTTLWLVQSLLFADGGHQKSTQLTSCRYEHTSINLLSRKYSTVLLLFLDSSQVLIRRLFFGLSSGCPDHHNRPMSKLRPLIEEEQKSSSFFEAKAIWPLGSLWFPLSRAVLSGLSVLYDYRHHLITISSNVPWHWTRNAVPISRLEYMSPVIEEFYY